MAGLNDFEDFISPLIEQQFPAVYRDEGPVLVAFTKAYYEHLEQEDGDLYNTRKMFESMDVDQSVDTFLEHFRKEFLSGFPKNINEGTAFTIKHIMDVYRSKGTPRAVELFLRLVYGIDSIIYIPGQHLMAASEADFYEPKYIEVIVPYDQDEAFSNFQGILVCPPTRITSAISFDAPESFIAVLHGAMVLSIRSSTKDSSFALVNLTTKCFGPEASAVK